MRILAALYGVTTSNLNKAVSRNLEHFPTWSDGQPRAALSSNGGGMAVKMAPKRLRRSRQWHSYHILMTSPAVLLVLIALALHSTTCSADECERSYRACEGTVMVTCDGSGS